MQMHMPNFHPRTWDLVEGSRNGTSGWSGTHEYAHCSNLYTRSASGTQGPQTHLQGRMLPHSAADKHLRDLQQARQSVPKLCTCTRSCVKTRNTGCDMLLHTLEELKGL